MDENIGVFYESGHGYWLEGFGCIRAVGGNNDCNTSHAIVIKKDKVQMDEIRDFVAFEGQNVCVSAKIGATLQAGRADDHHIPCVCWDSAKSRKARENAARYVEGCPDGSGWFRWTSR